MNKKQAEFKVDVQAGRARLRDKLAFLIDMIDSGKRFAAWVEVEREGKIEEDKSEFRYKKEWDTIEDKYGQSLNLNVVYDNVRFGDVDVEVIVYPVSNESKQVTNLLLYHLPEDCQYFTLKGRDIVVYRDMPQKDSEFEWVPAGEIDFLPYAHLFTELSEKYVYEIKRYEVSSFYDRELMFEDW